MVDPFLNQEPLAVEVMSTVWFRDTGSGEMPLCFNLNRWFEISVALYLLTWEQKRGVRLSNSTYQIMIEATSSVVIVVCLLLELTF